MRGYRYIRRTASYDLDNIISVAYTDNRDEKAFLSNFGATSVDLGAPGVSILSTKNSCRQFLNLQWIVAMEY